MSGFPHIEELIAHVGRMRLIDRIVAEEDQIVRSETTIRGDNIFFQRGHGLPAYVGFEFMAQTISAFDGLRRRRQGKRPVIGFLVGCRRYNAMRAYFRDGETVTTEVKSLLGEEGMASFDCRILDAEGGELASGIINVYRPPDGELGAQP